MFLSRNPTESNKSEQEIESHTERRRCCLRSRASGLPHFSPEVWRVHHYCPAHLKQARAHPRANAIREGIFFHHDTLATCVAHWFRTRCGFVKIIRREDGYSFFVVTRVEH